MLGFFPKFSWLICNWEQVHTIIVNSLRMRNSLAQLSSSLSPSVCVYVCASVFVLLSISILFSFHFALQFRLAAVANTQATFYCSAKKYAACESATPRRLCVRVCLSLCMCVCVCVRVWKLSKVIYKRFNALLLLLLLLAAAAVAAILAKLIAC